MNRNLITKGPDGLLHLAVPVVFSCGCGTLVPEARGMIQIAGSAPVPFIMTNINPLAKQYIRQVGLNLGAPSLDKATHSVLYNPVTQQFIDLKKSPKTPDVYANIYRVING